MGLPLRQVLNASKPLMPCSKMLAKACAEVLFTSPSDSRAKATLSIWIKLGAHFALNFLRYAGLDLGALVVEHRSDRAALMSDKHAVYSELVCACWSCCSALPNWLSTFGAIPYICSSH